VPQNFRFNLRYHKGFIGQNIWSYEGRKVGHSGLAELPIYREYAHGQAVLVSLSTMITINMFFGLFIKNREETVANSMTDM
jgi:hypothetical protein